MSAARNIRTWDDYKKAREAGQVSKAEQRFVAHCQAGTECVLGDGSRPDGPSRARSIGADLLRYLIVGGCGGCKLHEVGVALTGAYIAEPLNLMYCKAVGMTRLASCRFEKGIRAEQASFDLLNLQDSACFGLSADRITVKGSIFLRGDFISYKEVRLVGAVVGGQIDCINGSFRNIGGDALQLESAKVESDIFLSGTFSAHGEVSLSGAVIGGQLSCSGGTFENPNRVALNAQDVEIAGSAYLRTGFKANGKVSISSAVIKGQVNCIGGNFHNPDGTALNAQGSKMGNFLWRDVKTFEGKLNLSGTVVDNLTDDAQSWAKASRVFLDGFAYKTVHGPTSEAMRLQWLKTAKSFDGKFSPQPYEQLAYVLKRMGHMREARHIQFAKECELAASQRAAIWTERDTSRSSGWKTNAWRQLTDGWLWARDIASGVKHKWLSAIVGYGYLPARAVWWAVGTVVLAALFYSYVWVHGGMVPNSDVILTSNSWATAMTENPDAPSLAWVDDTKDKAKEIAYHYETFFSLTYAADVFIPLINFGQEAAWAPTTATRLGTVAWVAAWLIKAFGWIVTALGAAAITGIIRRE